MARHPAHRPTRPPLPLPEGFTLVLAVADELCLTARELISLHAPGAGTLSGRLDGYVRQLDLAIEAAVRMEDAQGDGLAPPEVEDQLDMLYHPDDGDRSRWEKLISDYGHRYSDDTGRCTKCHLPAEVAGAGALVSLLCAANLLEASEALKAERKPKRSKLIQLAPEAGIPEGDETE